MNLPSLVDFASMADRTDLDGCARLDKNHAPIADPQPDAGPSLQAPYVTRSGPGKSVDFRLDLDSNSWREPAECAAGIMRPRNCFHQSNIST
jgi:hypothetical protein